MINSIGNSASLAAGSAAAIPTAPPVNQQQVDSQALLSRLTPGDWQLVSAAVGHPSGPDAKGTISGLQPLLAWTIADQRASAAPGSGAPISVSWLQACADAGQSPGLMAQLNNAIAYLQSTGGESQGVREKAIDVLA